MGFISQLITGGPHLVYVYTYLACAPPTEQSTTHRDETGHRPGLCGTCAFPPRRRRRCEPSELQRQHAAVGGIMETLWHVTGDLNGNSPQKTIKVEW